MTARDPDARYETQAQLLEYAWEQIARARLHTTTLGLVRAYDAVTKRARVQPALRLVVQHPDGTKEPMDKPPIIDVPLRQPATGGHMVHHEIAIDDVVMLHFSERGIEQFKAQWGVLSDPAAFVMFQERDALAVPWGLETIAPVRATGWIVQNAAGSAYVSLDGDTIRLVTGATVVEASPSAVDITTATLTVNGDSVFNGSVAASGGAFTHNGTNVGDTHTHDGVTTGGSNTGTPS